MNRRRVHVGSAVFLLVALLAACGGSDESATATPDPTTAPTQAPGEPTAPAEPTAPPSEPTAAPTTPAEPTAAPTEPTAAPTTEPTEPDLPGEPWDLYVPAEGETIAVVGVAYDDILEVHEAPGELTPLTGTLAPTSIDVESLGQGRQLPASIWWLVRQGDVEGWVGSRFVSRLGVVNDITSQVVQSIGSIPAAETMLDLGMLVAEQRASTEPPSRIVVSVAPTVGDLGEITIDVVGLGDDAVEGERLHIFGQPTEGGEGFSLMAVEATGMCSRGVTDDGLCL